MPYIKKDKRKKLHTTLDNIDYFELDAGQLNFLISSIIKRYISIQGENYANYNEVIGVLECSKQEIYRTMIAPYEDIKKEQNGDF